LEGAALQALGWLPGRCFAGIVPLLKHYGVYDYEYASARLLQYLCNTYDKMVGGPYGRGLGCCICNQFHCDIEYFYSIFPNEIEVYEVGCGENDHDLTFSLIESVLIENEKIVVAQEVTS
jgi:hypothetical protein